VTRRVLFHPFLYLPEAWNGLDEHLLLLARYLDRGRYDLSVLIHASDGPQTTTLAERAGIHPLHAPHPQNASALSRLRGLAGLYRSRRIDLLHIHSPVAGGQAVAMLAARLAGVRAVVSTYHQIQPWRLAPRSRLINRLAHSRLVDHVLAVSGDVKRTLVDAAGVPAERIEIVHNGIDADGVVTDTGAALEPRQPGEVRLGFIGRLSPEKGVDGVLEAMALLAPTNPNARLFIIGEGPERAALEALAAERKLGDQVRFLGFRADARQLMHEMDVMVHAPVYEGFGLVVAEAMAAGRPVVGNDAVGGVKDMVVHGETGLLAPAGSASALADAMRRMAADPVLRQTMGQAGQRRFVEHFSARRMTERVEQIYAASLGRQ
jgi:glycosyltransferase involved in cell wall biosynthesis